MALQYVFGSSGAGKTHYLYEQAVNLAVKEPDTSVFFIVPEQFTMQAQKEIIGLHPRHGMMNIDVLSFRRLAYRVFEELAVENLTVLDDMGKSMVLRKVAAARKKELGLYQGFLDKNGFIGQLKSMLSEFYQYGIGPGTLETLKGETSRPLLKQKLQDMKVIYDGFQKYIEGRFSTAEEILEALCRVLPQSRMIQNSAVFLDGYTGFTPVQYRIIGLLLMYARNVTVSVTLDPAKDPYKEVAIQNLFYMGKHMVSRLEKVRQRAGAHKLDDMILGKKPRFAKAPAIGFLESHMFRPSAPYREKTGERPLSDQIWIYQGKNPAEEIRFICTQIERAVRREGMRYRDIAVITGALDEYGKEIAYQFQEAGIPFFLDDKKKIVENPLVELIRSVLEVISEDFSYESMFRYLKCGLAGDWERTDRHLMTDRMENYVRALGIRGFKQWSQPWERTYRGGETLNLVEINQFREEVMGPLARLREVFLREDVSVASVTEGLRSCLEEEKAEEKLKWYEEKFTQEGQTVLAKEYGQAMGLVEELFDRLTALLGEEKVTRKEYARILDAGFDEIQVGSIPATVDRVVAGDLTRTRLDAVKILFFVGVNEGIIPQKKEKKSLLTDEEREFFARNQVELAPTAREDGCIQRYYQYLILSKPSYRLVLSYAGVSQAGDARRPSSLIGEIRRLFPELEIWDERQVEWPIQTKQAGMARLIAGFQEENRDEDLEFLELYRWFLEQKEWREKTEKLTEAAFTSYRERGIGRAAARALYGTTLQGSVTRLEKYASCAYAHFLQYGLELMERREYELAAADIGTLFHQAIDRCFQKARDQKADLTALTEEARKSLVRECVGEVTEEYGSTVLKSSARNAYLAERIERITDRTVWALTEQMKKGDFIPAAFEVSFSSIDDLRAMKITLSEDEALHLAGRIDRLDLCEDETHVYVKIIDYKSGNTSFDLAALYYGLQLQLVVYMDAALEKEQRLHPGKEAVPAGMFYYHIKDPVAEWQPGQTDEDVEQEILKQLRMNGLVNSELEVIRHMDREIEKESQVIPVAMKDGFVTEARSSVASRERFQALRQYVREKLRAVGREILDGTVSVNPYKQGSRTGCDYCPYHAVCGFDKKTAGYGYRRLKALKPEEIWSEIMPEEEEGEELWQ